MAAQVTPPRSVESGSDFRTYLLLQEEAATHLGRSYPVQGIGESWDDPIDVYRERSHRHQRSPRLVHSSVRSSLAWNAV